MNKGIDNNKSIYSMFNINLILNLIRLKLREKIDRIRSKEIENILNQVVIKSLTCFSAFVII